MIGDPVSFLHEMFRSALSAADPLKVVPPHLPPRPPGRLIVIGAGKASAAMAVAVESHWPDAAMEGIVVTRYGYAMPTQKIKIVEASHPVPDEAGEKACLDIMNMVSGLTEDDTVLALISGGGSSLLSLPAPCLPNDEKRKLNKSLLRSGAAIHEMNCVRKHLSLVKGGRLRLAAHPAKMITLVISDVPGDDPRVVASGPTLPDPSTLEDARRTIEKYRIPASAAVRQWLSDPANETPKPGDPRFTQDECRIVSCARDALAAASTFAESRGIKAVLLGDDIEGEARDVGAGHIRQALKHAGKPPFVLLSGGETTVTMRGNGKGGRNAEYLLSAAMAAEGRGNIYGIACDTDGIDGSEDNAGAIFTPQTLLQASEMGINPVDFLARNDAYSFFARTGGLVVTGPTFTNVNDFRAILVL